MAKKIALQTATKPVATPPNPWASFATAGRPIRASLLPNLFQCSRLFVEKTMNDGGAAGEPAQTGNLVHAGIQEFHTSDSVGQGIKAIRLARSKYPDGNPEEAERLLNKYVIREQENPRGKVIKDKIEWETSVKIPPAVFDPTKQDIVITGHIDLLRDCQDWLYVVDHKSGRMLGHDMLKYYAPQIAGYVLMAKAAYPKRRVKGFITRLQDLVRRDLPFWWDTEIDDSTALAVLEPVQVRIAEIRMGLQSATGGKHCEYCPLGSFPGCVTGKEVGKPKKDYKPKELRTVDDLMRM